MFSWKWYLSELPEPKQDAPTVFSCFSCGGGSTMGYKRNGFRVLGNVEIDPAMNKIYVANNHPKYNFNMDIRDFNNLPNDKIPEELFYLDILDGSPPCTTFSTAGDREKTWGKEKQFREGQKKQTLDDLSFVFLQTVEKLKPKVVIMENVTGLMKGNAKGYVNEIVKRFREIGYDVQIFRLNSAFMEVPQKRERVFFVANNQHYPKIKMQFNYKPIFFKEIKSANGKSIPASDNIYSAYQLLKLRKPSDKCIGDINERIYHRVSNYNARILHDEDVCDTLTASGCRYRYCDATLASDNDLISMQSFPQDYQFLGQNVQYVCGMSVPPNMMAHVAKEVYSQWLMPEKDTLQK